jgi:hypothetical protein
MSAQHSPEYYTRTGHPPQPSTRGSEMDRVMCLSRQKLRLESARDEPDLRKLLGHVCTVEHVEGWIRENPPSRMAPTPTQDLELNDQQGETSLSLCKVESGASMFHHWPTDHLDRTVTVVREVEDDGEEDGDSSEESWNGSDTSDDTVFRKSAGVEAFSKRVTRAN